MNQRRVVIHHCKTLSEGNFFGCPRDFFFEAMRNLTFSQFKVWVYLWDNQDGWEENFSPAAAKDTLNLSTKTIRDAFNSLIEKGYIVDRGNNTYFDFYPNPDLVPKDSKLSKVLNKFNF